MHIILPQLKLTFSTDINFTGKPNNCHCSGHKSVAENLYFQLMFKYCAN